MSLKVNTSHKYFVLNLMVLTEMSIRAVLLCDFDFFGYFRGLEQAKFATTQTQILVEFEHELCPHECLK